MHSRATFSCLSALLLGLNIVLATVVVTPANAQSAKTASDDAKAALQSLLGKIETYRADFTQAVTTRENVVIQESQGDFLLKQPNLLRWNVHTPDETVLIANGEQVVYVDHFVEQVSVYTQATLVDNHPLMLLSQQYADAWHAYRVEYAPSSTQTAFVITPNESNASVQSLRLRFDNAQLSQVTSVDAQGQTSQFIFTNIVINQPLAPASFGWELPKGYLLDDQSTPAANELGQ
jgi:outer membrane lipoprotein carrier protein